MTKSIKYYILILIFCFCYFTSKEQQSKIDSLINIVKIENPDTNKLIHLFQISDECENIGSYKNGVNYCNKTIEFADFIIKNNTNKIILRAAKDYKRRAYTIMGIIYWQEGNYSEAIKCHNQSIKISEELGNKAGLGSSYANIALIQESQGNYPEALKEFLACLKIFESLGNKNGIAHIEFEIGNIYYFQKNYPVAIQNHLKALNTRKEIGDTVGIAASYNSLGAVYELQGNYPQALENFFSSLKLEEKLNHKIGISNCYGNIGDVYALQHNYKEALSYQLAALKIRNEIGDQFGEASSYENIATNFIKQKKYSNAADFLQKAVKLSKQIGYKENIRNVYATLTLLDSIKGDFKGAYENHKLYILYRDSLDNEQTRKKTIQSQMTYDFEKKEAVANAEHKKELENQQALAEEKNHKQRIVLLFVVVGLILVAVFAGFIFRSLRITSKQKQIIEVKNNETELQKHIIEEKHKEITDSINYAERIQRSFLATTSLLDQNLKNYFVFFQPKDVVSGDFYWASILSNGNFALATADSTGHGVPGAIMSILNISSLEKAIEQNLSEPSEILNYTRKVIIDRLKKDGSIEGGKDGMDCSLVCFDFANKKLIYSAANNPVWIVRENELFEFKADKMPVGKHDKDDQTFTQHEFQLQKNDVVYTLTDGLPDQFGGLKGKKFMYKQLKEILVEIYDLPMNEQKDILKNKFIDWKGNTEQVDDILIIGVKII